MIKSLESKHRFHSLFDSAVVLFDHIIQITVRSHKECCRQDTLFLEFGYRCMRGCIPIQRDLLGEAPLLDCLRKEALGRRNITVFTQEKINSLSLSIAA